MKIVSIKIPREVEENGVEDIDMTRLNNVVLLAGKNGSGKTRILSKIQSLFIKKPKNIDRHIISKNLRSYYEVLNIAIKEVEELQNLIDNTPHLENKESDLKRIATQKKNITNYEKLIKDNETIINWNYIQTDKDDNNYTIISFVPKSKNITDPAFYNKRDLIIWANNANQLGMGNASTGSLAKIQATQDQWFNATHQLSVIPFSEKDKAIKTYNDLKHLIKLFLHAELERDLNGDATLFGFPLGHAQLSDGQKILIQLCVAIFCQVNELHDIILFLDEPENHLHPSVLIEIIDLILSTIKNGQVWISTHSINLLAHFDPSSIWYVEDNRISYAGNIPEKVLKGLLGNDNEITKLQDFINLPAQFALNRYAYECLIEPDVSMTDNKDPQTLQINKDLIEIAKNEKIKILDYGAGKGRLLANILERQGNDSTIIIEKLNYVAFDPYDVYKKECELIISSVYGKSDELYFNDYDHILAAHDKQSFDVVIMCNVLHEIDPKEWIKLFKKDGIIPSLLNDRGVLLLVEDTLMPKGEKAYQNGFIVLDTAQLKDLFKITNSKEHIDFMNTDIRGDNRLKAHRIPKRFLEQITQESRVNALRSVQELSQRKIVEIRNADRNYKNGKIHAYWVQQFANASLALDELTENLFTIKS